jgi:hypothetical protein
MSDPQTEARIQRLESEVRLLKEQVKHFDQIFLDVQDYINELLKRAGIKGGFSR